MWVRAGGRQRAAGAFSPHGTRSRRACLADPVGSRRGEPPARPRRQGNAHGAPRITGSGHVLLRFLGLPSRGRVRRLSPTRGPSVPPPVRLSLPVLRGWFSAPQTGRRSVLPCAVLRAAGLGHSGASEGFVGCPRPVTVPSQGWHVPASHPWDARGAVTAPRVRVGKIPTTTRKETVSHPVNSLHTENHCDLYIYLRRILLLSNLWNNTIDSRFV